MKIWVVTFDDLMTNKSEYVACFTTEKQAIDFIDNEGNSRKEYYYMEDHLKLDKEFYLLIQKETNHTIGGWFHDPSEEEMEEKYKICRETCELLGINDSNFSTENSFMIVFHENN